MGNNGGDESVIINNGKKYNRIQIEGQGDDEEYLIDENGDIYSKMLNKKIKILKIDNFKLE